MLNDFQLTENFNLKEFECTHPDHNHVIVDPELVEKLQKLRERLGLPIKVTSAFRCEERNNEVGGAENSQHLTGRAADISLNNQKLDIIQIRNLARKIGFTGIGLYDSFIHLDTRTGSPAMWDNRS